MIQFKNRRAIRELGGRQRREATVGRQERMKKYGAVLTVAFFVAVMVLARPWHRVPIRRVKIVQVPKQLQEALLSNLEAARLPNYRKHIKLFSRRSRLIVKENLQKFGMQDMLDELRTTGDETAVLVRGLPLDRNLPPTPIDGSRSLQKKSQVIEALLIGFGQLAGGMPIAYAFEKGYSHPFIHEGFIRSGGSGLNVGKGLAFHSDMGYLHQKALVPNFLALFGVREGLDKKVTTDILDNRDALHFVPTETQKVLRQPHFVNRVPSGVATDGINENKPRVRSLLTGPASSPTFALPAFSANVYGVDDVGRQALKVLHKAFDKAERFGFVHHVHLMPGDLLIFDNRRVLHSRSAVTNDKALQPDPNGRVIFRAYFHADVHEPTMIQSDNNSIPSTKIATIKGSSWWASLTRK